MQKTRKITFGCGRVVIHDQEREKKSGSRMHEGIDEHHKPGSSLEREKCGHGVIYSAINCYRLKSSHEGREQRIPYQNHHFLMPCMRNWPASLLSGICPEVV
jgi:hypothetical protein